MSSKGTRRREARRRAHMRQEEQSQVRTPQEEGVPAEAKESARQEPGPAARIDARQARSARKRARRKTGVLDRVGRMHISPWLIAAPIVGVVVVVVAVLVLTSGSSGSTSNGSAQPTPDPRVAGLPVDTTVNLQVNDVNFSQTELSGKAGEVIEFVVTNTGTISHNMVVAGPDDEYDTPDDFEPNPFAIDAGSTGRVKVKIDDPGVYNFRCAFHPNIEFGTLTLQ